MLQRLGANPPVSSGSSSSVLSTIAPQVRRTAKHIAAFSGAGAGGALTGYIAAGTAEGAAIAGLFNVGLFGTVGAVTGASGRLTPYERVFYGILGLGGLAGCGYLFWQRKRGRR